MPRYEVLCWTCRGASHPLLAGEFEKPPKPDKRWCPACRLMVSCEVRLAPEQPHADGAQGEAVENQGKVK